LFDKIPQRIKLQNKDLKTLATKRKGNLRKSGTASTGLLKLMAVDAPAGECVGCKEASDRERERERERKMKTSI
jgi:hypothetical protein